MLCITESNGIGQLRLLHKLFFYIFRYFFILRKREKLHEARYGEFGKWRKGSHNEEAK